MRAELPKMTRRHVAAAAAATTTTTNTTNTTTAAAAAANDNDNNNNDNNNNNDTCMLPTMSSFSKPHNLHLYNSHLTRLPLLSLDALPTHEPAQR